MSNLKTSLAEAEARLLKAERALTAAIEERDGFRELSLAALDARKQLKSRKGKTAAQIAEFRHIITAYESTESIMGDSVQRAADARRELEAAQKLVHELRDAWAKEELRIKKREEQERIRREQRAKAAARARRNAEERVRQQQEEDQRRGESEYAKRKADEEFRREWEDAGHKAKERQQKQKAEEDESKKRKRAAEEPSPPRAPKVNKSFRHITNQDIAVWHLACDKAFLDKSSMRVFPPPPAETCREASCQVERRALDACKCNIRKAFQGRRVAKERFKFHPDKFSTVPEGAREVVKQAANEVFVVVNAMHERR